MKRASSENPAAEIGSKTPESTEAPAEVSVTAEDVTNTASTDEITDTTPDSKTTETPDTSTPDTSTPNELPQHYLSCGYYVGEGKGRYPDPVLVDQAEEIGKALASGGVSATAFNRMLRTLKAAKKLPFDAQEGALKKLMPQVIDQERKKKAPPLLREIVERNQAAVQSESDYAACLEHFWDIAVFLTAAQTAEK